MREAKRWEGQRKKTVNKTEDITYIFVHHWKCNEFYLSENECMYIGIYIHVQTHRKTHSYTAGVNIHTHACKHACTPHTHTHYSFRQYIHTHESV